MEPWAAGPQHEAAAQAAVSQAAIDVVAKPLTLLHELVTLEKK